MASAQGLARLAVQAALQKLANPAPTVSSNYGGGDIQQRADQAYSPPPPAYEPPAPSYSPPPSNVASLTRAALDNAFQPVAQPSYQPSPISPLGIRPVTPVAAPAIPNPFEAIGRQVTANVLQQAIARIGATQVQTPTIQNPLTGVQPVTFGGQQPAPDQTQPPLNIYQTPDGQTVVMPDDYVPDPSWTKKATLDDPNSPAYKHAKDSNSYIDSPNLPQSVKDQAGTPGTSFDVQGLGKRSGIQIPFPAQATGKAATTIADQIAQQAAQSQSDLTAMQQENAAQQPADRVAVQQVQANLQERPLRALANASGNQQAQDQQRLESMSAPATQNPAVPNPDQYQNDQQAISDESRALNQKATLALNGVPAPQGDYVLVMNTKTGNYHLQTDTQWRTMDPVVRGDYDMPISTNLTKDQKDAILATSPTTIDDTVSIPDRQPVPSIDAAPLDISSMDRNQIDQRSAEAAQNAQQVAATLQQQTAYDDAQQTSNDLVAMQNENELQDKGFDPLWDRGDGTHIKVKVIRSGEVETLPIGVWNDTPKDVQDSDFYIVDPNPVVVDEAATAQKEAVAAGEPTSSAQLSPSAISGVIDVTKRVVKAVEYHESDIQDAQELANDAMRVIGPVVHALNPVTIAQQIGEFITDPGGYLQKVGSDLKDAGLAALSGKPFADAVKYVAEITGDIFNVVLPRDVQHSVGDATLWLMNQPSDQIKKTEIGITLKIVNGEPLNPAETVFMQAIGTAYLVESVPQIFTLFLPSALRDPANAAVSNTSQAIIGPIAPISLPVWIMQHPDEAKAANEKGGYQAVWEAYQADVAPGILGTAERALRDITVDPWTYVPVIGMLGKTVAKGAELRLLDPDTGTVARAAATVAKPVGRAIELGAKTAEKVGNFGADYALEGVGRLAERSGLTRKTAENVTTSAAGEAASTARGVLDRAAPAETSAEAATRERTRTAEADTAGTSDTTTTKPKPKPTSYTPDGEAIYEEPVTGADGTTTTVRTTKVPTEDVATSEVPVRWQPTDDTRYISQVEQQAPGIGQELRNRMAPEWRVADTDHAITSGKGAVSPDSVILSSKVARDTIDTVNEIAPEYTQPTWEKVAQLDTQGDINPVAQAADDVIRDPWSDTTAAREYLQSGNSVRYAPAEGRNVTEGTTPKRAVTVSKTLLSDTPTQTTINAANRYVDMIQQHLAWHPESISNPDFQRSWKRAVELDNQLRDRGLRRTVGGDRYRSGTTPLANHPASKSLGIAPRSVERPAAGFSRGTGPASRATGDLASDAAAEDAARPPVVDTWKGNDGEGHTYQLDADTVIEAQPVPYRDVPPSARKRYPEASPRKPWSEAVVKGEDADPTPIKERTVYAPDEQEAVDRAAIIARDNGWVEGETPEGETGATKEPEVRAEPAAKTETTPEETPPATTAAESPVAEAEPAAPVAEAAAEPVSSSADIEVPDVADIQWRTLGDEKDFNAPSEYVAPDGTTYVRSGVLDRYKRKLVAWHIETDDGRQVSYETPTGNASNEVRRDIVNRKDRLEREEQRAREEAEARKLKARNRLAAEPVTPTEPEVIARADELADELADDHTEAATGTAPKRPVVEPVADIDTLLETSSGPRTTQGRLLKRTENGKRIQERKISVRNGGEYRISAPDGKSPTANAWTARRPDGSIIRANLPFDDAKTAVDLEARKASRVTSNTPAEIVETPTSSTDRTPAKGDANRIKTATTISGDPRPGMYDLAINSSDGTVWLWDVPLAKAEVDMMTRFVFENGDTYLDRLVRNERSYRIKNPKMWDEQTRSWAEEKTRQETTEDLDKRFGKGAKSTNKMLKGLDTYSKFRRERALASWTKAVSYPATQSIGNLVQLIANARFDVIPNYFKEGGPFGRIRRGMMKNMTPEEMLETSRKDMPLAMQIDNELGILPDQRVLDGYRKSKFGLDLNDDLVSTQFLEKLHPSLKGLGNLLGSKWVLRQGQIWDTAMRSAVYARDMIRELRPAVLTFKRNAYDLMDKAGISRDEQRRIWQDFQETKINKRGTFSANDARDYFRQHLGEGQAQRLSRDWQQQLHEMRARVNKDLDKLTFSGGEVNADIVLKRVLMFHYFQSRQSWMYARLLAQHPFLVHAYQNYMDAVDRHKLDGMPWMKGWFQFMSGPFGLSVFANPASLLTSYITFRNDADGWNVDGETKPGGIFNLIDSYLGIAPVVGDALNLLGVRGDVMPPDPLGLYNESDVLTDVWNIPKMYGIGDPKPIGNWLTQQMENLRETVSGANPFIDTPIKAGDVQGETDRQVRLIAEDEAAKRGLDLGDPNEDGISEATQQKRIKDRATFEEEMADPNSDLYQTASKRYILGQAVGDVLRLSPLGPVLRPKVRQLSTGGTTKGQDLSTSRTKEETGIADMVDPDAIALDQQAAEYNALTDTNDTTVTSVHDAIAYGTPIYSITIGKKTYTPEQIMAMSASERSDLADAYLADYGLLDRYDEIKDRQDKFREDPANKEYNQFKDWSKGVRAYDGGVDGYWDDAIEKNPSARDYYEYVNSLNLMPADRESRLTSVSAWDALNGYQRNVYGGRPLATNTKGGAPYDPLNIAGTAPTAQTPYVSTYETNLRKDLPEYYTDLKQWDTEVKKQMANDGIDPTTPFEDLNTTTRKQIETEVTDEGFTEPTQSLEVKNYIDWAQQQAPGADVSVDAYLAWDDKQYRKGAKDRLNKQVQSKPPTNSTDFWDELLKLIDTHDYTRYPNEDANGNYIVPKQQNEGPAGKAIDRANGQ